MTSVLFLKMRKCSERIFDDPPTTLQSCFHFSGGRILQKPEGIVEMLDRDREPQRNRPRIPEESLNKKKEK